MSPRAADSRRLVDDMGQYAQTIAHWVDKGHDAFRDPETGSQATIERQFEKFEEAANALGASFRNANPGIPWEPIFEIRNELSHPYQSSYDPERLWTFARDQLPKIARKLRRPVYPG
jgi:uncharacterized protein with HEPN domain